MIRRKLFLVDNKIQIIKNAFTIERSERMRKNEHYGSVEELYLDNYRLLAKFAGDYVTDNEIKKEIVAIVSMKIVERAETLLNFEKRHVKNYLRVTVRSVAADYYKSQKREEDLKESLIDFLENASVEESSADLFLAEEEESLAAAIQTLSEKEKILIYLKYELQLSFREIGELLHMTEGNVRVQKYRTVTKLKKELQKNRERREDTQRNDN